MSGIPIDTIARNAMKNLRTTLALLILTAGTSGLADQTAYDDCILEHLKGAKLDVAAHLIKQACQANYRSTGFLSDGERAYNDCLLEYLVGVESRQAAMDIKAACGRKHK